jgi:N-acetylmuramoyl-L-alanine amidase
MKLVGASLALVALAVLAGVSVTRAQDGPARPVAFDAQVAVEGAATKLSFTLSEPVTPKVTVLQGPDRIVLDLPEVNFQLPAEAGRKPQGLVRSYRYGLFAHGRSRVVIDLAGPSLPGAIATEPVLNGVAHALTIELRKADRDAFARAAAASLRETDEGRAVVQAPPAGDGRPVVVIDPGHGGIDSGAIGVNNAVEKDVVFTFARELREKLERSGQVRVVMTRENDSFVSLPDRVRIAQAQQASLFVSVHADTLSVSPEVRGLTVYTNADKASDAEAARLADTENRADMLAGVDASEDPEEVAGILSDLTRRETRTYSHLFARTLVGQMSAASKLNKNPTRSAGFRVLKAPDVPSVLIELGYLSSKTDVENLTAPGWRDKATDSVAVAITNFLAPKLARGGGKAEQAAAP